jgi:hypothetical protein
MGAVWRAEHIDLGTPAAVKLIDARIADSTEALARFRREAQAAASLRSSHVVQVLDYGVDAGRPYIAMELLEGESLARRLARKVRLDPAEASIILRQVAKALTLAHEQGIVHRDLKPDNVFLAIDGREEVAKVLDFGIAKIAPEGMAPGPIDDAVRTKTGAVLGTPSYMSPEQVIGDRSVDHRADIWAFAIIACECLTGRRPFAADNFGRLVLAISAKDRPVPSSMGPVPVGFDAWFARCTAPDPRRRCGSILLAAEELCRLAASEPAMATLTPVHEDCGASSGVAETFPLAGVTPRAGVTSTFLPTRAAMMLPGDAAARRPRAALVVALALAVVGSLGGYARYRVASRVGDEVAAPSAEPVAGPAAARASPAAPTVIVQPVPGGLPDEEVAAAPARSSPPPLGPRAGSAVRSAGPRLEAVRPRGLPAPNPGLAAPSASPPVTPPAGAVASAARPGGPDPRQLARRVGF